MSPEDEIDARVVGALVGLAVGDALGAPVEGLSPEAIAARYPAGVSSYLEEAGPRRGQVTDDTEMALLVARSLCERRTLDMEDVSRRLVTWKDGGGIAGPSTSRGVEALRRCEPWQRAGSSTDPSSGCLPRCVPIALGLPEGRVPDATLECCLPTHRHEVALASSVALNVVLARLVAGARWEAALEALDSASLSRPGAEAVREAIRGGEAADGAAGVLVQAVVAVNGAGSAGEAITAAVSAGGDADTAGSVAGALAGARWGADALPEGWVEACEAGTEAAVLARWLTALRQGRAHDTVDSG